MPISDRKETEWMIKPAPGPHPVQYSIPLTVLLRDVLNVASNSREVGIILHERSVLVDGVPRTNKKYPVGLMDVISLPKEEKHYRIKVDWKGRLVPEEIDENKAKMKLLRITGKNTVSGGKHNISFHDGRNMLADNHLHVGDTVEVSLPEVKLKNHIKLEKGARCLIMDGKHAGKIVTLKELIGRKGIKPNEAMVEGSNGEFITVARYLFAIGDEVKKNE
jgi:small subunit ribosomal protein S4e